MSRPLSSDSDEMLTRMRCTAQDLAVGSGLKLIHQWEELGIDPMISCIALIRMAYTLAPEDVSSSGDGPEQFAVFCKLVAQKDGVLDRSLHDNDNHH